MDEPLNRCIRKDVRAAWNSCHDLVETPVLELLVSNRPFLLDTDSSAYQIGVTLLQQHYEENPTPWATIGFSSRSLTDVQRRYSASDSEFLAVVWSILSIHPYMKGKTFTICSNNTSLF